MRLLTKTILGLALGTTTLLEPMQAQTSGPATGVSPTEFAGMRFRMVGPTRGGRVTAVTGVPEQSLTFYLGASGGGVWKTTNGGISFTPVFQQESIASIGDIAIAPSDPRVVWIGSGEANLRNSTYYGNGVYKSVDGGATWQHMGLPESHHIGRVLVHPTDPDIVHVAAQGHLYSENPERGVFMTVDGGQSWTKTLDDVVDRLDDPSSDPADQPGARVGPLNGESPCD